VLEEMQTHETLWPCITNQQPSPPTLKISTVHSTTGGLIT